MGARRRARGRGGRRRGSLSPRLRVFAAALAGVLGLVLAALASGLEPRLLAPAHWAELGAGVGRGLEALSGVTLPYGGVDPWPDITLRLGGALLVTLAAVLAAWPRDESRGFPFFALASLLVLVATPMTAIGTSRSLVSASRWPRSPSASCGSSGCRWPGIGVAVAGRDRARRRAAAERAADRDGPWFDYRTWAEGLGTPASVRFDWEHSYGALAGSARGARCCGSARATAVLEAREPQGLRRPALGPARLPDPFGPEPEADLDQDWKGRPQWTGTARVTVRGLRGGELAGAGTTVSVDAGARRALATFSPGTWQADGSSRPATPAAYAPRPASERARAGRGHQRLARPAGRRAGVVLPLLRPELPDPDDSRGAP